jgi:hypothetical protein
MYLPQFGSEAHISFSSVNIIQDPDSEDKLISVLDPVAILAKCHSGLFLCIAQIYSIKVGSHIVEAILSENINADEVSIGVQVMKIVPASLTSSFEWEWTGSTTNIKLPEYPSNLLQILNPQATTSSLRIEDTNYRTYSWYSNELIEVGQLLFESFKSKLDIVPSIDICEDFPYRSRTGNLISLEYFLSSIDSIE